MISYAKLWTLLKTRGMKRTDLLEVTSTATLAKLGKNENVSTETIEKICIFLDCQPSDIMEVISQEKIDAMLKQLDVFNGINLEQLNAEGVSKEEFKAQMSEFIDTVFSGKTMAEYINEELEKKLKEKE